MKPTPPLLTFILPRVRDVLFAGILLVIVLNGSRFFNQDGDLGRHITVGNYMLDTGSIPTRDVFSHTMRGADLTPHEWLAQLLFALAHQLMGLGGTTLLFATLVAGTFLLAYHEMIRRGTYRLPALLILMLAIAASAVHWLVRPHAFTFLFIAVWTYGLERMYTNEGKGSWLLPLLMWLWANTHGAFIAGFVVWGAYVADWGWNRYLKNASSKTGQQLMWTGALACALTFVNPAGWRLWQTSVGYVGSKYLVDRTVEYMSPDFHQTPLLPFLLLLAVGLFFLSGSRRLAIRDALLLAGWAVMSLYSARNIPLFAIITAPIYGMLFQSWLEKIPFAIRQENLIKRNEAALRGNAWLAATFALAVMLTLSGGAKYSQFDKTKFPVKAVGWLQTHPQAGNVFNEFAWGGYVLYAMYPTQTVFIDGQTDFYGVTLTQTYEQISTLAPGWDAALEKYAVRWVLIPTDSILARALASHAQWETLYTDSTAVIFRRLP